MKSENKFICPLPFKSLSLGAGYRLRLCCHDDLGEENESEDYFTDINQGLHSKTREQMLNGQVPKNCQTCFQIEERGGASPRQGYLDKLKLPSNIENKFYKIQHLDITIDSHCNLMCRMCNPVYSERISKEYEELGVPRDESFLSKWSELQGQFENILIKLKPALESAEHLVITGGEPLLSPNAKSLVDELLKCKNIKNKTIRFFTNATVLPQWLPLLLKNSLKVELYLSLDASSSELHYIRYPANWANVKRNLEQLSLLSEKHSNLSIRVHTVIQALNFHILTSLFEDLKPFSQLFPFVPSSTVLSSPKFLCASVLPLNLKEKYINDILKYLTNVLIKNDAHSVELKSNIELFISHLNGLKHQDNTNRLFDFLIFMKRLDKSRNQSLSNHNPELFLRYK